MPDLKPWGRAGGCVKTYIIYIDDSRYTVPTMDTLIVSGDARARELAAARLASSAHYRGAQIWEGDRLVDTLQSSTTAP
jgi:hypothetical protein